MPYRTIIVGTDGSETAEEAVRHAVLLSRALGATLHIVSAVPGRAGREIAWEAPRPPDELRPVINVRAELEAMLEKLAAEPRSQGVEVVCHAEVDVGPAEAILALAERVGADLIVVGNRGMTGISRLLGSVPNAISHNATCSVAIVRTS